jgi:hypothetical protein
MQRLNIEAARRQAGQELLQTPNPSSLPQSAGGGGTPISLSTPDILNSLIAITNPFFESTPTPPTNSSQSETATQGCSTVEAEEPHEKKVFANLDTPAESAANAAAAASIAASIASSSSILASGNHLTFTQALSAVPTASTALPPISTVGSSIPSLVPLQQQHKLPSLTLPPPTPVSSVQSMRSQLIKEGLKLTIQTKRKISGKGELDVKSELVAKRPKREEVEFTSLLLDFSISNDSSESSSQPTKVPQFPSYLSV